MGVSPQTSTHTASLTNNQQSTAELSTGVLCVSCPEITPLFHRKQRSRPSASIVDGSHRKDSMYRGRVGHGISVPSNTHRKNGSEAYIELNEAHMYDFQILRAADHEQRHSPGEVQVTHEFSVDTHIV